MTPSSNKSRSLFSSLDANYYGIARSAFSESLLFNILFQESILIHDSHFFINPRLATYLKKSGEESSLFAVACKVGIIIPAFRFARYKTLNDVISDSEKTYGKGYSIVCPELGQYKDLLVSLIDCGLSQPGIEPFYWPPEGGSLGDGYLRLATKWLQSENAPEYTRNDFFRNQRFRKIWRDTKELRHSCINQAALRTIDKGQAGLQKTEILNVIADMYGLTDRPKTLSAEYLVNHIGDKKQRQIVEIFIRWITQFHSINQAILFNSTVNHPEYNLDGGFMIDSILRSPIDAIPDSENILSVEVMLPSIVSLCKENPKNLIKIRSDYGSAYLQALRIWQTDPKNDNSRKELKKVLRRLKWMGRGRVGVLRSGR